MLNLDGQQSHACRALITFAIVSVEHCDAFREHDLLTAPPKAVVANRFNTITKA